MRANRIITTLSLLFACSTANAIECVDSFWEYLGDHSIYATEFGLFESGATQVYGIQREDGVAILPTCRITSPAGKPVKIPVLLVDFHDYQPGVDLSNPNNPDSGYLPGYVRQTPEQISAYLNGPIGPAQYFNDVSGGQLQLEFVVHGWIETSDTGYLLGRDFYMSLGPDEQWSCDRDRIARDLMIESIVYHGVDWSEYDLEANDHSNVLKNIDAAVLLYEGGPGLCSGTNLSYLGAGSLDKMLTQSGYYGFHGADFRDFVVPTDPNSALMSTQTFQLLRYNNIPETAVTRPSTATWAHEIGHQLLGFGDYYLDKTGVQGWALSGRSGINGFHPSAYEKWLYGGWLQPNALPDFGVVEVAANQHPDGGFDPDAPYLYKFDIDPEAGQYLTFEYHWFDEDGNDQAKWAISRDFPSEIPKQSGILINAFDWTKLYLGDDPQIRRLLHDGRDTADYQTSGDSFQPGDSLNHCYSAARCVHIAVLELNGGTATVFFSDHEADFDDYDRDGAVNSEDSFVYDARESVDTDSDGIGNNADTDDDNDEMPDTFEDQYGFDPLNAADANADADGDGTSNLDEFRNGTNPTVSDLAPPPPPAPAPSSGGGGATGFLTIFGLLFVFGVREARRQAEGPSLGARYLETR